MTTFDRKPKKNPELIPLPQDIDAEQAVLGAILIDGEIFEMVHEILSPKDFYKTAHVKIYEAMKNLYRENKPIDLLTLYSHLKGNKNLLEEVGESTYITYLTELVPTTENVLYYAEIVREKSIRRRLCLNAEKVSYELKTDGIDISKAHEILGKELEDISNSQFNYAALNVIALAEQEASSRSWLLQDAIPDGYPTIIYGAGGLGKSFLALHLAILASLGGQKFLGLKFPKEPRNVLIVDYELDVSEQVRRAWQIARGLNLQDVPKNLHYICPAQGFAKLLPNLRGSIKSKYIDFIIIDSLGASGTDGESVQDVVSLLTKIKELGLPTLVLDHQSKMQTGDTYGNKTPFGTVYKQNLSRSVFQLSKVESVGNRVTLRLRHRKANFSRLLEDLVFDLYFEGDRVLFTESNVKSDESKETELVYEAIREIEREGVKVNQDAIKERLKGVLGKGKVVSALEEGEGEYWDKKRGERNEYLYISKNPKSGSISNQTFGLLENEDDYGIPPELMDENEESHRAKKSGGNREGSILQIDNPIPPEKSQNRETELDPWDDKDF